MNYINYYITINNLHKEDVTVYIKPISPEFEKVLTLISNVKPLDMLGNEAVHILDIGSPHDPILLIKKLKTIFNISININENIKPKIIFVNRKEATNRFIINGDLLFNTIKKEFSSEYDVGAIFFETMTFEEQIKTMVNCKILIGCHGAGLTNCIFMSKDSLLIDLFPECFYTDCYKNLSKMINIKYLSLHGTNKEKSKISLEKYMKEGYKDKHTRFRERDKSFDIDIDIIIKLMKSYINTTNL